MTGSSSPGWYGTDWANTGLLIPSLFLLHVPAALTDSDPAKEVTGRLRVLRDM